MERPRAISFAVVVFTVLAGGALLLEHTGFFAGAFRTEILARVDDGDMVSAADIQ
ncbi:MULTISPECIES: hypothetical protein [unclassified Rhizobium]|uniref:hypothetical protein n=1 Tax=unclassified Rhizobium TaxID=2613769 RepID=UPI000AC9973D|nr:MULTISPECIES: hypothetical protein [unclassified Rhizobium]